VFNTDKINTAKSCALCVKPSVANHNGIFSVIFKTAAKSFNSIRNEVFFIFSAAVKCLTADCVKHIMHTEKVCNFFGKLFIL
ncbi:MAG: hypothetical protein WAV65_05820, partial [Ruminococcus bromii]